MNAELFYKCDAKLHIVAHLCNRMTRKNKLFLKKLLQNLEGKQKSYTFASVLKTASRGGAVVARWAHNPKAGGSIPSPATKDDQMVVFFIL